MAFGRFERSAGPQPMSDINMTPLVDVMLVLVVIFIITAPLMTRSLDLQLPSSAAAQASAAPQFVTLEVDPSGQAFLDHQAVSLEQLQARLVPVAKLHPETEVQLRADQAVPYGRVVEVMGVAQKAGLSRIGFVAQNPATATAGGK